MCSAAEAGADAGGLDARVAESHPDNCGQRLTADAGGLTAQRSARTVAMCQLGGQRKIDTAADAALPERKCQPLNASRFAALRAAGRQARQLGQRLFAVGLRGIGAFLFKFLVRFLGIKTKQAGRRGDLDGHRDDQRSENRREDGIRVNAVQQMIYVASHPPLAGSTSDCASATNTNIDRILRVRYVAGYREIP